MKFGIHNPSWLFGSDPAEIFEAVKTKALWAENHGFTWFSVMDHLIQIGNVGAPDEPFMEGWTVLTGLAAVTARIRLATLVSSVHYRNPAHLAKIAAGVDQISPGRHLRHRRRLVRVPVPAIRWSSRRRRRCASGRWKRPSGSSSACGRRNGPPSGASISRPRAPSWSPSRFRSRIRR